MITVTDDVDEIIYFEIVADASLKGEDGEDGTDGIDGVDGLDGSEAANVTLYVSDVQAVSESNIFSVEKTLYTSIDNINDYVQSFKHDGATIKFKVVWSTRPYDVVYPTVVGYTIDEETQWSNLTYIEHNIVTADLELELDVLTNVNNTFTFVKDTEQYVVSSEYLNPNDVGVIHSLSVGAVNSTVPTKTHFKNGDDIELTIQLDKDLTYISVNPVGSLEVDYVQIDDGFGNMVDSTEIVKYKVSDLDLIAQDTDTFTVRKTFKVDDSNVIGNLLLSINANTDLGSSRNIQTNDTPFDNDLPFCDVTSVIYINSGLEALADTHEAELYINAGNFDTVEYTSFPYLVFPDNPSPTDPINVVKVQCVDSNIYEIDQENVTLKLYRIDNDSTVDCIATVKVASKLPTISITVDDSALRTNGMNLVSYPITLTTDQELLNNNFSAPNNAGFVRISLVDSVVIREIEIDQSAIKGQYVFDTSSMRNLAGLPVLTDSINYRIQGFVEREYLVEAFSNTIDTGETITDPSLVVVNSIDLTNPTWDYLPSIPANYDDIPRSDPSILRKFTIQGNSIILLDKWYVNYNASGIVVMKIEEKTYGSI